MVNNSPFDISDTESRNRMPGILKQIDSIIINGKIIDNSFNTYQREEEKLKLIWTKDNPDLAESLYELEDHNLLYGQIDIVGLDNPDYFKKFISLFECDFDKIDCALMSIGNYAQREKNKWRYQSGSTMNSSWRNLFHHSDSFGFENTKKILHDLLSRTDHFNNAFLQKIIDDYINKCENITKEYDWRYYYIKYDVFRPGRYGKYWWSDFNNEPYCFTVLWGEQKASRRAYQPFLKAVDKNNNISLDDLGEYLIFDDDYLECENNAYVFKDLNNDKEIERLDIKQNKDGIDIEDRIKKYLLLY